MRPIERASMEIERDEVGSPLSAEERAYWERVEGVTFDIQRYSLHDGPGLRTNVFLKGCPLRCGWCANPESQQPQPELGVFAVNCIRCGQFSWPCPEQWAPREGDGWKPALLEEYGRRATACPAGGVRWIGQRRTAGSVVAEVRRDVPFYEDGGGMTLTGGEPCMQPEMAGALLRLAKAECIDTAIETCGHTPWENLARLLPYLDTILYDVKHIDSTTHRAFTGAGNELILANLRRLAVMRAPVTVRVPLISGFNASEASLRAIAEFLTGLDHPLTRVDLLPYHTLGKAKYAALARPYPWAGHARLSDERVGELAGVLRSYGLDVTIGG